MLRSIIKYGGLALVIIGIILVMKNLFKSDAEMNQFKKDNTKVVEKSSYDVSVSLLDKDSNGLISGGVLVIEDASGNEVTRWISENSVHLVPNLAKGSYTLVEKEAPNGYHLNNDGVKFIVSKKNIKVTMYNTKMTDEEKAKYEAEQRALNTKASEVHVDNTLSNRDITMIVAAISSVIFGIAIIFYKKEA